MNCELSTPRISSAAGLAPMKISRPSGASSYMWMPIGDDSTTLRNFSSDPSGPSPARLAAVAKISNSRSRPRAAASSSISSALVFFLLSFIARTSSAPKYRKNYFTI
jgi:hypothetical protein